MPDHKPTFRQATIDDAALIAALGERTFVDSFGSDNRPEDIEQYITANFSLRQIQTELADPAATFLLTYEGEELIGYAKLHAGKGLNFVKSSKPIELVRIYIEKAFIGKNYGSALMGACLEEARRAGYDTVWLGVWEKNERAIRFYEKWGFTIVGSQEFLLGSDRQTDYVMVRHGINAQPSGDPIKDGSQDG